MESQYEHKIVYLSVRYKVNPADIICCIAEINYTKIYYLGGSSDTVSIPLKKIEQTLRLHGFHRVHKSYLINKKYIVGLVRNSRSNCYLELRNNIKAIISRRKTTVIQKILIQPSPDLRANKLFT